MGEVHEPLICQETTAHSHENFGGEASRVGKSPGATGNTVTWRAVWEAGFFQKTDVRRVLLHICICIIYISY